DFIARMVETANRLRPDLIAITGDLVDGSVEHLGRHAAPLAELSAPHGTWFVTGNHEYYSGADEWIDELARLGIPTLRNRRVELTREGAVVDLVGVTDHRAGQYDDAPDLEGALRGRDPSRESILLAHQPVTVKEASQHDIGLQLSGHTHGGQFWPWSWVVNWVQPVARGWARFGETQIWVNTGTGYWGPPLRTGSEPEITLLTLRAQA
ncbi:MAG TPA: metallophosphoesterase, partial [Polyangiaceae bacterium]|nr:metallophosphoesterase [Polyangiaceae bacterium]